MGPLLKGERLGGSRQRLGTLVELRRGTLQSELPGPLEQCRQSHVDAWVLEGRERTEGNMRSPVP